jgi:hypothetical protein
MGRRMVSHRISSLKLNTHLERTFGRRRGAGNLSERRLRLLRHAVLLDVRLLGGQLLRLLAHRVLLRRRRRVLPSPRARI